MARANNGGWDFVKAGGIYQYKEEGHVCMVKILEDNSNDLIYNFKLQVVASSSEFNPGEEFKVKHTKNPGGYWNEMIQLYETAEYTPLPLGSQWSKSLPGHERTGIKF